MTISTQPFSWFQRSSCSECVVHFHRFSPIFCRQLSPTFSRLFDHRASLSLVGSDKGSGFFVTTFLTHGDPRLSHTKSLFESRFCPLGSRIVNFFGRTCSTGFPITAEVKKIEHPLLGSKFEQKVNILNIYSDSTSKVQGGGQKEPGRKEPENVGKNRKIFCWQAILEKTGKSFCSK